MHWRAKGVVQKVLGHVPGGEQAHYLLQKRFGGLRGFTREFDIKMDDWRLMAGHLRVAGVPITGARLFEIGTGWYPTFPLACYLGGARQVVTVDLNRHIKPELVRECADNLGRHVELIAEACAVPVSDVVARQQTLVSRLADGNDVDAATLGVVQYQAPSDASRTTLKAAQIDCVFSNSVLEHVLPAAVDVHPQFAHIPPERLCVTSIDFIGRKPPQGSAS